MRSIFPSKLDVPRSMNGSFCKPFFNVESRYYYGMNMDYEKRDNNSEMFFLSLIGRFIYLFRWIIVSYVFFSSFKFILSQFLQRKKNTPD